MAGDLGLFWNAAGAAAAIPVAPELEFLPHRNLQVLPNYTSPPTDYAIWKTPPQYRTDFAINAGRNAAANGTCTAELCQIPFPAEGKNKNSLIGVVLYGGALVDPRAYSPLAAMLAEYYGLPTVIPIFNRDLQFTFGQCSTGRVEYAKEAFPSVEKWVLAGHSFGGIAAGTDFFTNHLIDDTYGGVVHFASYLRSDVGCGDLNLSNTSYPFAQVLAAQDGIVNNSNIERFSYLYPANTTFRFKLLGARHGSFGSYDDSGRRTVLGQVDGTAFIPEALAWQFAVDAILHVASRVGRPLPSLNVMVPGERENSTHGGGRRGFLRKA